MKAQPGEVGGKPRFRAGDAEIRHHREADAGADRGAMHGGDDRLAGAPQPLRFLVQMPAALCRAGNAIGASAAEIGAGAEMLALGAQHDRADVRGAVIDFQRVGDLRHHVGVDEIVRAAPHLDRCDVAGHIDGDVFIGPVLHGGFLPRCVRNESLRSVG